MKIVPIFQFPDISSKRSRWIFNCVSLCVSRSNDHFIQKHPKSQHASVNIVHLALHPPRLLSHPAVVSQASFLQHVNFKITKPVDS